MRLLKYITEKTFAIRNDVEYVYKKGFKSFFDDIDFTQYINNPGELIDSHPKYLNVWKAIHNNDVFVFESIDSNDLPSKDAKRYSQVHPVLIGCGFFPDGSAYQTAKTIAKMKTSGIPEGYGLIKVSLNMQALRLILRGDYQHLRVDQKKPILEEIKPARVKAAISHEISHWMDDMAHNQHITNMLELAQELDKPEIVLLNKVDVTATHYELNAIVHGVKSLKNTYKKEWDKLTLFDIASRYGGLMTAFSNMHKKAGVEALNVLQKAVVKRLHREKLLGKNMRKFIKPEEIFF